MVTVPATRKGRQSRQAVLDAAVKVFQRDGIFAARIVDIADEAGVSKAAVYRYFESREVLLAEVVDGAFDDVLGELHAADPSERMLPVAERFRLANRRYLRSYHRNGAILRLVEQHVATEDSLREVRRQALKRSVPPLSKFLTRQMELGVIDSFCESDHLSEALGAMVDRAAYVHIVLRPQQGVPAVLEQTLDVLWSNVLGLDEPERAVGPARVRPHIRTPSVEISQRIPDTAKGERTRERLLRAAQRVFETMGYLDGRVADVAAAADVSHGTFYNYFDSRFDVFAAVAFEVSDGLLRAFSAPAGQEDDAERSAGLLERVMRDNLSATAYYRSHSKFIGAFEQFATVGEREANVRLLAREAFIRRSATAIARMQREGIADRRLNPWVASDCLTSMLERSLINWFVLGFDKDYGTTLEARVAALAKVWVRAVIGPTGLAIDR